MLLWQTLSKCFTKYLLYRKTICYACTMNVHLFGKINSSCCANWSLKATLDQIGTHPETFKNIKNLRQLLNDYLDLFSDKDSATSTIKEVICMLRTSRFRLHKQLAKDREIFRPLPVSEVSSKIVNFELGEIPLERALGLLQSLLKDLFQIKAVNKTLPTSKRGVLSFDNSIFDPLEMLDPATLRTQTNHPPAMETKTRLG